MKRLQWLMGAIPAAVGNIGRSLPRRRKTNFRSSKRSGCFPETSASSIPWPSALACEGHRGRWNGFGVATNGEITVIVHSIYATASQPGQQRRQVKCNVTVIP